MIELTIGNSGATAFQTGDNMPFIIYNNNHSGSILLLHFFCCSCILIARSICVYKPTHYTHSLNSQWSIDSAHRKNGSMSRQPRRRIYVCIVVDTENVFVVAIHSHKMRSYFFYFRHPSDHYMRYNHQWCYDSQEGGGANALHARINVDQICVKHVCNFTLVQSVASSSISQ